MENENQVLGEFGVDTSIQTTQENSTTVPTDTNSNVEFLNLDDYPENNSQQVEVLPLVQNPSNEDVVDIIDEDFSKTQHQQISMEERQIEGVGDVDTVRHMNYDQIYRRALQSDEVGVWLSEALQGNSDNEELQSIINRTKYDYTSNNENYEHDGFTVIPDNYKTEALHSGKWESAGRNALNSFTLGYSDEIIAFVKSGGDTSSQEYADIVAKERDKLQNFKETNPVFATVAEVGGFIGSAVIGGAMVRGVATGAKIAAGAEKAIQGNRIARTALGGAQSGRRAIATGAVADTIYGTGVREGEDRFNTSSMAKDFGTAVLFGGALVGAGKTIRGVYRGVKGVGKGVVNTADELSGTNISSVLPVSTKRTYERLFDFAENQLDIPRPILEEKIAAAVSNANRGEVLFDQAGKVAGLTGKDETLLPLLARLSGKDDAINDIRRLTLGDENLTDMLDTRVNQFGVNYAENARDLSAHLVTGDIDVFESLKGRRPFTSGKYSDDIDDLKTLTAGLEESARRELLSKTIGSDSKALKMSPADIEREISMLRKAHINAANTINRLFDENIGREGGLSLEDFNKILRDTFAPKTRKSDVELSGISRQIDNATISEQNVNLKYLMRQWNLLRSKKYSESNAWNIDFDIDKGAVFVTKPIRISEEAKDVLDAVDNIPEDLNFLNTKVGNKVTFSPEEIQTINRYASELDDGNEIKTLVRHFQNTISEQTRIAKASGQNISAITNPPESLTRRDIRDVLDKFGKDFRDGRGNALADQGKVLKQLYREATAMTDEEFHRASVNYGLRSENIKIMDDVTEAVKDGDIDRVLSRFQSDITPDIDVLKVAVIRGLSENGVDQTVFNMSMKQRRSLYAIKRISELSPNGEKIAKDVNILEGFDKWDEEVSQIMNTSKNIHEATNNLIAKFEIGQGSVLEDRFLKNTKKAFGETLETDFENTLNAINREAELLEEAVTYRRELVERAGLLDDPTSKQAAEVLERQAQDIRLRTQEATKQAVLRSVSEVFSDIGDKDNLSAGIRSLNKMLSSESRRKVIQDSLNGDSETFELIESLQTIGSNLAKYRDRSPVDDQKGRALLSKFIKSAALSTLYDKTGGSGDIALFAMKGVARFVASASPEYAQGILGMTKKESRKLIELMTSDTMTPEIEALGRYIATEATKNGANASSFDKALVDWSKIYMARARAEAKYRLIQSSAAPLTSSSNTE